jgi:hypothetical protein
VVCVGLGADRAGVVKLAGARAPRVVAETSIALAYDALAPAAGAFAPLTEALARPALKAASARIVLADALVRYFIVARPQGVRHRAELEELMAARFEEQFGLAGADWMIAGDLDPAAQSYLACAAPRKLIEALRRACAGLGLRLAALEPFAVSEMNRWRGKMPRGAAWFGAADAGTVTLGYRSAQGWLGVRTHAVGADAQQSLPLLAERDALVHGVAAPAAIVCTGLVGTPVPGAPATGAPATGAPTRLGAGLWPGRSESWSRTYRVALSGVWP